MLTDGQLLELAGKGAFERGRTYHRDGRITLERRDASSIIGQALGTEIYSLWIKRTGEAFGWDCECPAADDNSFCKHLVAAVLTARDGALDADDRDEPSVKSAPVKPPRGRKPKPPHDLGAFLRAQSVERLAGWLLSLADNDREIERRLNWYSALNDPARMKTALGKMLTAGGYLDYRRSIAYGYRLDTVIEQLRQVVAQDAASGRAQCEYALQRLLKIYARSDDSSGAIGDRLRELSELHAEAVTMAPHDKGFAKVLLQLQQNDQWDLFELPDYWDALGPEGQLDYGRRIVAEFEALKPRAAESERWYEDYGAARRAENYARMTGDFNLLQRVLRRQLSLPYNYQRVLESLQEFGRDREALAWAEQTVKRFPDDAGARTALAACLAAAGLDDEGLDQHWHAFQLQPRSDTWDALKRAAAAEWPTWRERALAEIAAREQGHSTHRASLLEHDGDLEGAVALAQAQPMRPDVLELLASRIERDQPLVAGEFLLRRAKSLLDGLHQGNYRELAQTLKRAARCLPTDVLQPHIAHIRTEHGRKTKLMQLLDSAGL